MFSFLICLALLIGGYFVYGGIVERPSALTTVKRRLSRSTMAWTTWFCRSGSCL